MIDQDGLALIAHKLKSLEPGWLAWHDQKEFAGKTLQWYGSDTEQTWVDNMSSSKSRRQLQRQGFDKMPMFEYVFNSEGFREREFDDAPCVMALGCSHVMGVGIPEKYRWTNLLTQQLDLRVLNLGVGGASVDTCFRLLSHWIQRLQVRLVIISLPSDARFEIASANKYPMNVGPWVHHHPNTVDDHKKAYDFRMQSDHLAAVERIKTCLACEQICSTAGVPLVTVEATSWAVAPGDARDLMHPGIKTHSRTAALLHDFSMKAMTC